jgi:hypothetical protein
MGLSVELNARQVIAMDAPQAVEVAQSVELAGNVRVPRVVLVDGLGDLERPLEVLLRIVERRNVLPGARDAE